MDQVPQSISQRFGKYKSAVFPVVVVTVVAIWLMYEMGHPANKQRDRIYHAEAAAAQGGPDVRPQLTAKAPVVTGLAPVSSNAAYASPAQNSMERMQEQQLAQQFAVAQKQQADSERQKLEDEARKAERAPLMVPISSSTAMQTSEKKDGTTEIIDALLRAGKPELKPDPPLYEEKKGKADFSVPIGSTNAWQNYAPGDRNHAIYQGTLIHTILMNDIQSDLPGPVACQTTQDVMSFDQTHVLVPKGTLVFGHTQSVSSIGQSRVALVFDYMRMPDQFEMTLEDFAASDEAGKTGVTGHVNNHLMRAFGTSAAIGLIGAASMWGANGGYNTGGADSLRYGFGSSMSQSAMQAFSKYAFIMPTITVHSMTKNGPTPVEIFVIGDLYPPFYEQHEMVTHKIVPDSLKEESKK